jgi:predicted dehydrogenase
MSELNFAVIGCGMLAQGTHLPNICRSSKATLHTCCDVSEDILAACREQFGPQKTTGDFHEAISDPEVEAICLATTEALRLPVIEAAAEAGKPVYTEKPLAATWEEALEIQRVVNESGIPFCVGHNRRRSPAMIDAHRIFRSHVEDPKISPWRWHREGDNQPRVPGENLPAAAVRINDDHASWKGWVYDDETYPHGPMLWEMTHFVDVCNWFLSAKPVEVCAMENGLYLSSVSIRYDSGSLATIAMCANGSFGYPKELYEFMGFAGVVSVHHMMEVITAGIEGAPRRTGYPPANDRHPEAGGEGGISGWLAKRDASCAEAVETGDNALVHSVEPDKGHAAMLEAFVDQVRGEGPVVCSVNDAVLATRTCLAAIRSAREKRFVSLDEI